MNFQHHLFNDRNRVRADRPTIRVSTNRFFVHVVARHTVARAIAANLLVLNLVPACAFGNAATRQPSITRRIPVQQ